MPKVLVLLATERGQYMTLLINPVHLNRIQDFQSTALLSQEQKSESQPNGFTRKCTKSVVIAERLLEQSLKKQANIFQLFIKGNYKASTVSHLRDIVSYADYNADRLSAKDAKLLTKQLQKSLKGLTNDEKKDLFQGRCALACLLSPELSILLTQQKEEPSLRDDDAHQLQIAEAKAKLSMEVIGYEPKPAGGKNGAVFVLDVFADKNNEKIAVFKPVDTSFSFIKKIKEFFGQARLLNRKKKRYEQLAETVANKMAKTLGFTVTPESKMSKIQGKEGAFILYLGNNYKVAETILPKIRPPEDLEESEVIALQKAFIFDFLVKDKDGHAENWMLDTEPLPDGHVKINNVRFVDFGNSFSVQYPGMLGHGNEFAWGKLPVSERPFHPEVINFIKDMKKENLRSFFASVNQEFLYEAAQEQILTAFDVLKENVAGQVPEGVAVERISSPAQLSSLHKREDYEALRKNRSVIIRETEVEDGFYMVDFS
jgi:hypothetical protein